jgi:hypothetical protein
MTHRRPKPGSFQDELGGVIERIAPADLKRPSKPDKPGKPRAPDPAQVHDHLFESAWRKSR